METFLDLAQAIHPWPLWLGLLFSFADVAITDRVLQKVGPDAETNLLYRFMWRRFGRPGFWATWAGILALYLMLGFDSPGYALFMALFWAALAVNNLIVLWAIHTGRFSR